MRGRLACHAREPPALPVSSTALEPWPPLHRATSPTPEPGRFEGRSRVASGLLLFDGLQPLLECINTVLERRNRAGSFLDVLGRCPGLLDRRFERLHPP